MKKTLLITLPLLLLFFACSKRGTALLPPLEINQGIGVKSTPPKGSTNTRDNFLLGKWYLYKYESHCGESVWISEATTGDYVLFEPRDTMRYIYTDGSWGYNIYQLADSITLLLNGAKHTITTLDDKQIVIHYTDEVGFFRSWQTLLRNLP